MPFPILLFPILPSVVPFPILHAVVPVSILPASSTQDFCQLRIIFNFDRMRDLNFLSRFVVDAPAQVTRQKIRNMLDQRSRAVDIQALQPIANSENRLARFVGILQ